MTYTLIPYVYADAANYKASGVITLAGVLTPAQLREIESKLDDGEHFIPEDLGLNIPELQETLTSFPSEDDHVWHALELRNMTHAEHLEEGAQPIEVKDFVAAFERIDGRQGWDVEGASIRLGI